VIAIRRGRQRLLRRARAVAVAHRQGIHRCARRRAIDDKIGLGPLPAIEGVHGGAGHEAARMRLLRQPRQRQRLQAFDRERSVAPARILGLHRARCRACVAAPDCERRRP